MDNQFFQVLKMCLEKTAKHLLILLRFDVPAKLK